MPALHSAAPLSLAIDPAVALQDAPIQDPAMPPELGGVRIRHLLGQGGMGRVYLGRHIALDRDVAVKVMRDRRSGDVDRFLTEARLAARIDHPNIVRILHAGDERGMLFLIMELVPGLNLKRMVQERNRLPWREAADLIRQAAHGLGAAHRAGIIHRDVKPSNMLVTTDGRLKVADLGVARALDGDPLGTTTGNLVGTPAYMAPEQARDPRGVTPAADVYALGASLWHLLTGEVPFSRISVAGTVLAHQREPLPDLGKLVPGLPPAIIDLVRRMLDKDPARRPANGDAVAQALEQLLEQSTAPTSLTGPAVPAITGWRSWSRVAVAALAFAGLALVGWTGVGNATRTAALPVQPIAAPAGRPVAQADPWQTPPRAVFAITERLSAAAVNGLDDACRTSGLAVVERQRIDTLVREQDLAGDGRTDPATAGRLGRLVGGHIALFVTAVEDRVEVRTVLVETGEVVASRLVAPAEIAVTAAAGITGALAQLPVQGRINTGADGRLRLSAGSRHGLKVGDRLELRQDATGAVLATATVTMVERDQAVVTADPARPDCAGMMARRLLP